MNKRVYALAILALLAVSMAGSSVAAAQGPSEPQPVAVAGAAWIAAPGMARPAGASGRYGTTMELVRTLPLWSNWDVANGGALAIQHSSNTRLSLDANYNLVSVDQGRAHGKFTLTAATGATYEGSYNSEISTVAGCTIFDRGNWSLNGGLAQGHGAFEVCLNFDPGWGTFVGSVTMTGQRG